MKGLESLILTGMIGCTGQDSTPIDTSTYDTGDADTDTDSDTDTDTNNAPVISTTTLPSGTVNIAYNSSISASDSDGDKLAYSLTTAPSWLSINNSGQLSGTPTASETDTIEVKVTDSGGLFDTASYALTIVDNSSGTITLGTLSDLSGYTNETLSGSGSYTGDAVSANITLDSSLDAVVQNASASLSGSNVNYSLAFNNDIDWSDYSSGYVSGTATIEVCDSADTCQSKDISVSGYAPTEVLITAQTADDKDPLSSATIDVACDSGDSYTLTPNSDGEATAYLNNSDDVCMITSDAGSTYAVYSWEHDIDSGSEDLVSDGYYEVWAEVYDNFKPSDTEPEYATCYSGRLDSSRNLLLYANSMFDTVDGTDYGRREFKRFFEDEITTPIQYWVDTKDTNGDTLSSTMYDAMYAAIVDAASTINTSNPSGTTYLQEASSMNDANIIFSYDDTWTSHGCYYNSSTNLTETYASGKYCHITLHMDYDVARTSLAELFGDLGFIDIDGCDDSITDGGEKATTNDWFVLETTQNAKYQNLMERTY